MGWNMGSGGEGLGGSARARLLIADRQPLVAEALATLVAARGFAVVARAHYGADAAAIMAGGGVTIALIDLDLHDPGPAELLRDAACRQTRMIFMAASAEHPGVALALDSGAAGLVLKSESANSLVHCIATVATGGRWFDLSARHRALDHADAVNGARQLTRRERDVARLVATGQRNRGIAGQLGISEGTVKMHLHNVYAKLGLESRTQLAMDERLRMLG